MEKNYSKENDKNPLKSVKSLDKATRTYKRKTKLNEGRINMISEVIDNSKIFDDYYEKINQIIINSKTNIIILERQ